jgi:hypothetical protein
MESIHTVRVCRFVFGLILLGDFFVNSLSAQSHKRNKSLGLQFAVVDHSKTKVSIGDTLRLTQGYFVLSACKFYMGGIDAINARTHKKKLIHGVVLVNLEDEKSLLWNLHLASRDRIDTLQIQVGIDSLQHADAAYLADLDPINSMYWSWQSGFIQLKLEGTWYGSGKNIGTPVEWHLGGYRYPYGTGQTIRVPAGNTVKITVDLSAFLEQGLANAPAKIMSPGAPAAALMGIFVQQNWKFQIDGLAK